MPNFIIRISCSWHLVLPSVHLLESGYCSVSLKNLFDRKSPYE